MRRQGIGSWNPQVAGQGDQAAARGLESLGSTIGNVSQEISQSADQVQLAQAHGAAGAALATAHGGLQDITDPSQVLSSDPSKPAPAITDINTKINAAASMISNPIRQAEFKASMMTPVASYTAAALERGRTLNNQTGIASLEQNTTDIINNAATLSDENAAGHALDSIGAQVSALQKAGALNPEQAQKYRQEAVQSFGETRYKYLVGQLEAQPPGQRDYSALTAFTGHMLHGFGAGTDGASVAPGDQSAAPGSPQTGVPLPPARGDGSPPTYVGGPAPSPSSGGTGSGAVTQGTPGGMSPSGGPWIKGADGKSYATDADGNIDTKIQSITPKATPVSLTTSGGDQSAGALRHYEGLKTQAYWDVNHWRVGYGSDTITKADGTVETVGKDTQITPADAERDLQRRVQETQSKIIAQVTPQAWASLSKTQQAAVTSMGYNYGMLPQDVAFAVRGGGGPAAISAAIMNHAGDNGGVNRTRRMDEARAANGGSMPSGLPITAPSLEGPRVAIGHVSPIFQASMGNPGFTNWDTPPQQSSGSGTQVASLGPVGLPVQPPIGQLPSTATLDDASASASSRAPPSSSWPAGAQGVMGNADGSLSYQMKDGSFQPVPGSRATGAPHNGFAPPPAGSVLAAMSPNTRATLQLEGINAIRRMQREDQAANQKDDRGDLASINNTVKAMESGVPIGDKAWAALTSAYSAPGATDQVRYAYAVADATRRVIQGFKFSSPQDVAAAITNMREQYAQQINNPATAAQSGVLGATIKSAQNYLNAYEQGVAKDPIGRAAMQGAYGNDPVKPIDPKSPTFSQDFAHRVEQAKVAQDFFKLKQVNYLQPQDKVTLRQIASQGGDDMVNLAKGVTAGAGADAPAVFKQIGKEAAPLAQIGQWAMDPNADHSTEIRQYADYLAAAHDPQARKNLPMVDAQTMRTKNIADPLQDAGSELSTDDVARLRGTASVLASANVPAGMDPKNANSSLPTNLVPDSFNRAVGGTKTLDGANWWGGIAKVGSNWWGGRSGGYSAIVPTNMRQDLFESAIGQINQNDVNAMGLPPMASGGQKLTPADIQKGKFVAVTNKASGMFNGQYQVQFADPKDGVYRPAMNTDGKPWLFDMRRAQGHLGEAIPGLFMSPAHGGGSPSGPIIPPSHNYQNVKGLSITPDDVASADTEADASGTP